LKAADRFVPTRAKAELMILMMPAISSATITIIIVMAAIIATITIATTA
jgi:hypothetical protein